MSRALIVVDVQNDFCEGGSLAVSGGAEVARRVSERLHREFAAAEADRKYAVVVATRDHHIDPAGHFSATPNYVETWPPHCVVGTEGSALHPNLDPQPFDAVFFKGEHAAAYSGFEGRAPDGRLLANWLRDRGVTEVDICGIATDYCVRASALDAQREGFTTHVLTDLIAGVAPATSEAAVREMRSAGVTVS